MVDVSLDKLQTAFVLSGKTAEQVGREMDIDGSTIRRWRAGEAPVPNARIYRLAFALGVAIEYLLTPPEVYKPELRKPSNRMSLQFGMDGMPMLPPGPNLQRCSCGKLIHGEKK